MKHKIVSTAKPYTALQIVSPMLFGDEKKNQDRARWFEPGQIACVCDGVTSSPHSTEAAELVTSLVPVVFHGNVHDRLALLCDLLIARRLECQESNEVLFPNGTSEAMQHMLRKIILEKQATSFQTTLIAAKLISDDRTVLAHVIKCGDSAFFAFSAEGELLTSSLSFATLPVNHKDSSSRIAAASFTQNEISFGPGDEILVRIEGQLLEYTSLAKQAGIRPEHMHNWLVCSPLDSCCNGNGEDLQNLSEVHALSLKHGDRLLVPQYLYGRQLKSEGLQYRVLRYSSTIRSVLSGNSVASVSSFDGHGSVTMVLPDHFYCGNFDCFKDRFPAGTNFILCSDGFYGSFSDWQQLWSWLQENAKGLTEDNKRKAILEQLHLMLNAKGGDDDISFVWVQPRQSKKRRC